MKGKAALLVVAMVSAAVGFQAGVSAQGAAKKIVRSSPAELQWSPVPGTPVMEAKGWSAPNGANCGFNKFPKGTKLPLHTHTADVSAVIITGQFGSFEEGAPAKLSGPGTYAFIPGGLKHTTECGPQEDCVVFRCQPGAFDLVEAGAK
jgi:quercetin dioxygenase-like cupin family protein